MVADVQVNLCVIQTVTMLLGFLFVIIQFRKYVAEITKTHDWNRRKASQEACYNFMQGPLQDYWNNVYAPLCEEFKKWSDLDAEQQTALREVIYYFENLGISLKNNILDEDIIWDYFGSIWPLTFQCAEQFVVKSRQTRNDYLIYEHFENYAKKFKIRNKQVELHRQQVGRTPGKPVITG